MTTYDDDDKEKSRIHASFRLVVILAFVFALIIMVVCIKMDSCSPNVEVCRDTFYPVGNYNNDDSPLECDSGAIAEVIHSEPRGIMCRCNKTTTSTVTSP